MIIIDPFCIKISKILESLKSDLRGFAFNSGPIECHHFAYSNFLQKLFLYLGLKIRGKEKLLIMAAEIDLGDTKLCIM